MNKLFTIITSLIIIAMLAIFAGCDSDTSSTITTTKSDSSAVITSTNDSIIVPETPFDVDSKGTKTFEERGIYFELPESWDVQGTTAYLYEQPEDSTAPKVEIEVYTRQGTEEEAKKKIRDLATEQAEVNATFTEMEIGGRNIFIEQEKSDLFLGEPMWINNIEFEKDGRIYSLWMTDRIQNRMADIEMLIDTINYKPFQE